jgi:hypothetical protein
LQQVFKLPDTGLDANMGIWHDLLVVETLSVVIQLLSDEGALEKFHNGKLNASGSISFSKKTFPVLGPLYGFLSNQFVHIGPAHATVESISAYKDGEEPIEFIISNMRGVTLLTYMVTEVVFFEDVAAPKYWQRIGKFEYKTSVTEETRHWQASVLGVNLDDKGKNGVRVNKSSQKEKGVRVIKRMPSNSLLDFILLPDETWASERAWERRAAET